MGSFCPDKYKKSYVNKEGKEGLEPCGTGTPSVFLFRLSNLTLEILRTSERVRCVFPSISLPTLFASLLFVLYFLHIR